VIGEKGNSHAGDILVKLNPKDTNNFDIRIGFEAKIVNPVFQLFPMNWMKLERITFLQLP